MLSEKIKKMSVPEISLSRSCDSVPAGHVDNTVEHTDVDKNLAIWGVVRRKLVGDAGINHPRRKPAKRGLPQGRVKENRTRPGISTGGSVRTNSHKTNPSKLRKARSESGRQTVAGQLKKEGRGRKVYPPRRRFVVRDNDLFSVRTGKAVPHASRQAVQGGQKMGITAHHVPESAVRGQAHTSASAVACRRS